jgi:hypothetical protein
MNFIKIIADKKRLGLVEDAAPRASVEIQT